MSLSLTLALERTRRHLKDASCSPSLRVCDVRAGRITKLAALSPGKALEKSVASVCINMTREPGGAAIRKEDRGRGVSAS